MAELKKTVLIVDDEGDSRKLLREIFAGAGYEVLEAADGLVAMGLLQKREIHLLVSDRSMPGLGGLELLTKLRHEKIMVTAIIVSA